jgi:glycosyltransferase involved in cell wall biosynthesis
LRILIISGEYPPALSGIGDYTWRLASHLNGLGHKVVVLTSKNGPTQNQDGIDILRQVDRWNSKSREAIRNAVKVWNPDVVHLQYMTNTFQKELAACFIPLWIKSSFPGLRVVTTFHEFAAPFRRLALLPLLFMSDAFIVTNQHHERMLSKLKSAFFIKKPAYKIPLAANVLPATDAKGNRAAIREQLGAAPDDILLVRFGILHDMSAPQIIKWLKTFSLLRQQGVPAKLLLIGKTEPQAKAKLMEGIQSQGLQDFIHIKGDLSADVISAYLYASDIGLALYPDGISEKRTAALALFAHELPVVALQKQPLPEEFKDGEDLLCVHEQASDNTWVETIKKLITDCSLRSRLVQNTRKVTALHDWSHIAGLTEKVYS